jgi:hypothetical protein
MGGGGRGVFLSSEEFPYGVFMNGDSPLEGEVVLMGSGCILKSVSSIHNVEDVLIVWYC